MTSKVQGSFAAGVISKEYFGRRDQIRYQTGLAQLRNMVVMKSGGVQNRTGTEYKGVALQPTLAVRLRTWRFTDALTFMLEFSNLKLTFRRNGVPVLEAAKTITAATKASPCQLTSVGHGLSVGDRVYLSTFVGMTELNDRYFKVRTVPTADTFTLSWVGDGTAEGTALDSSAFTTYTSGGTAERVYTIATPYATGDLATLQFCQSAGTMVITHPTYAPRKLTRASATSWTIATPTYGPTTSYPTGGSATFFTSGANTFNYMVTSEDEATGIESLSGTAHTRTINAITNANPAVCTVTASVDTIYQTGDEIQMGTVSGMTELSGRRFRIARLSTTTFQLVGENSTSYGVFSGTNSVYLCHINLQGALETPTIQAPNTVVTNAAATTGVRYTVYKEAGGIYGFIGQTYALTFSDNGITPDTLQSVPIYREPFQGASNYPAACTFYQQRLIMGGSANLSNGADTSVVGDFFNFTIHSPHEDTDAVRFTTAGYVDSLKHMVALDKLVAFTSGAEWVVAGGGEGGTLTPTEINAVPRTYNGSGDLFPLLIDGNAIYKQDRGQIVRDFFYSLDANGFKGKNLIQFSDQLVKNHTITDWAFQRSPNGIIWAVREDGTLLSCTYQPEHEFYGWAEHDLDGGVVENVCVVPEGTDEDAEDVLYMVVARTLGDGSTTRYIERLASRNYADVVDAVFMDSTKSYDGTGTGTITLSGSGWTNATSLTATFTVAQTNATVGNEIQLNGLDDDGETFQLRCRITGVTSTTIVTVIPHTTVPITMRALAVSDWAMAVYVFRNLHHLEGETVSIFGDRVVVASALNPAYDTTYTVSGGIVTLLGEQRYAYVHIGLPITAQMETLDFDPAENPNFMASTKLVKAVAVRIAESRSFYVGTRQPDDDDTDPIQRLYEPKIRQDEDYDALALTTAVVKVRTQSRYNRGGRVFLRILEPAPVSVLEVAAIGNIY